MQPKGTTAVRAGSKVQDQDRTGQGGGDVMLCMRAAPVYSSCCVCQFAACYVRMPAGDGCSEHCANMRCATEGKEIE